MIQLQETRLSLYEWRTGKEVLEQQLWHLGCKLWEELAIYPKAQTLGLSETF